MLIIITEFCKGGSQMGSRLIVEDHVSIDPSVESFLKKVFEVYLGFKESYFLLNFVIFRLSFSFFN